jgi:hypothetical protein
MVVLGFVTLVKPSRRRLVGSGTPAMGIGVANECVSHRRGTLSIEWSHPDPPDTVATEGSA